MYGNIIVLEHSSCKFRGILPEADKLGKVKKAFPETQAIEETT